MVEFGPDEGFPDFPERSWRPWLIAAALALGVAVTAGRLFFSVTDQAPSASDQGTISRQATDAAIHPSAVLPDLEALMDAADLPDGPAGGLSVARSGFATTPSRFDVDQVSTTFAVVIDNAHVGWTASSVEVVVDLVAADGTVIATERFLVPAVPEQRSVAVAGVADAAAGVVGVDVALDVALWTEGPDEPARIETGPAAISRGPIGGLTTTVPVTNRSDVDVEDVHVVVVHSDAQGQIIGGFDSYLDHLSPGESVEAIVDNPADIDPELIGRTDVYAFAATP